LERLALSLWLALAATTFAGSGKDQPGARPTSFPRLPVPAGNGLSDARASLSRQLFYDQQLTVTGGVACTSCQQDRRSARAWRWALTRSGEIAGGRRRGHAR
jgi:cytochrome c peroxidase